MTKIKNVFRAWWYRMFHDPDPYPPEAAEAPDAPRPVIVAGSDLDRTRRPMAEVNLRLRLMADEDPELSALCDTVAVLEGLYVAPEVDR